MALSCQIDKVHLDTRNTGYVSTYIKTYCLKEGKMPLRFLRYDPYVVMWFESIHMLT